MLGFGKPTPVKETEAEGEIERCFHEIKMTMRASGVNLNFRTWADFEDFFPAMWDAMRPLAETRTFETASDNVRAKAARLAESLGGLNAASGVLVGESEAYQIQAALDLYHYINPKLLVFTAVVRLALEDENADGAASENISNLEKIERGVPARMFPMEMMPEKPDDERLREIFDEIIETFDLSSINSDYRTLALWTDYLGAVWEKLKPLAQTSRYEAAANELRDAAIELSRELPAPVSLSKERVEDSGEDYDLILKTTKEFERLLAPLILNIALISLDWKTADVLAESPFPARTREAAAK